MGSLQPTAGRVSERIVPFRDYIRAERSVPLCSPSMAEPAGGGPRAEAARNDERILVSARAVFVEDPGAPIAAVAHHAGVGIGALYRRYAGKEDLLRALCAEGPRRYIEGAETAIADFDDPWERFPAFMHRAVEADATSLTQRLA